jgi:ATP-dependent DNA helicase RecG
VGPLRGDLLKKELEIFTFGDLLNHFPFRHIDKTAVAKISDINFKTEYIQVAGRLQWFELVGEKQGRRLVAHIKDNTGELELVWFKGISYLEKILEVGVDYLLFGKIGFFNGKPQMAHPDLEIFVPQKAGGKIFILNRPLSQRAIKIYTGSVVRESGISDNEQPTLVLGPTKFDWEALDKLLFPPQRSSPVK